MKILRRLVSDCRGAAAAEYALLLALLGTSIAVATIDLGNAIACSIDRAALIIAEHRAPKTNQYGNSDPNGNAFGHRENC